MSNFGGQWTAEKLDMVREYLQAYTTALKNQPFDLIYIDAFAGTGYCSIKGKDDEGLCIPELAEPETQQFIKGSARIALEVDPGFSEYIFIEKDINKIQELDKLKIEFPDKKISIINSEANASIRDICSSNWGSRRAVMFLDPYGMQVDWTTVEAIANTKAIDMWYLFPLGVAVNRLLNNDSRIPESHKKRLNALFGDADWEVLFYQPKIERSLFGDYQSVEKIANSDIIKQYWIHRLETIFPGVARNPYELKNSKNCPLYLLCFAVGNKNGKRLALDIAQHILRKK